MTSSHDQLGDTTTYAYDAMGNVTTETDPGTSMAVVAGGSGWSGGYATLAFATNLPPSSQAEIIVSGVSPSGYDGTFTVVSSTATSVTYALGTSPGAYSSGGTIQVPTVTHNAYDGANRLQSTCVDGVPSGSLCGGSPTSNLQVSNMYDNDGNVLSAADADSITGSGGSSNKWQQSNVTRIGGQAQTATPPDGSNYAANTTYTANGQVATVTNANGVTATYAYDSSDRVTQISYSDGTPTVSYSYNPAGSVRSVLARPSGTTSPAPSG